MEPQCLRDDCIKHGKVAQLSEGKFGEVVDVQLGFGSFELRDDACLP